MAKQLIIAGVIVGFNVGFFASQVLCERRISIMREWNREVEAELNRTHRQCIGALKQATDSLKQSTALLKYTPDAAAGEQAEGDAPGSEGGGR